MVRVGVVENTYDDIRFGKRTSEDDYYVDLMEIREGNIEVKQTRARTTTQGYARPVNR